MRFLNPELGMREGKRKKDVWAEAQKIQISTDVALRDIVNN